MLGFLFQLWVLFPLTTYIVRKKGGDKQSVKFAICMGLTLLWLSFVLFIHFANERNQNIYEMLEIDRDSNIENSRKAFRMASLKYHPDKNSDPKAKEIFLNLNSKIDLLKDEENKIYYDLFMIEEPIKMEKPTAMGISDNEYNMRVLFFKLFTSIACLPTYFGWAFIPLAILESDQKRAKIGILLFVVSLWALEISFCIGYAPKIIRLLVELLTPQRLTFAEGFVILRLILPFLILTIKTWAEVYYYKIYEKHEVNDKFQQLSISQAEKCNNVISIQKSFIHFLNKNLGYDEDTKEGCFYHSWELNKVLNELTKSCEEITKLKSKRSFLGVIKFIFFVIVMLFSIFS